MDENVADFVAALDENTHTQAQRLGLSVHCWADEDGGQTLYNSLPAPVQKALAQVAMCMRVSAEWPPLELVRALAERHQADTGQLLLALGWTPPERHALKHDEKLCMEFSRNFCADLAMDLECAAK